MWRVGIATIVLAIHSPLALAGKPRDDEVGAALAAIAKVGPQAAGSVEARKASDRLAREGVDILPRLLAAMDTDSAVAANWYRSAYERVVDRELPSDLDKAAPEFPLDDLRSFVADPAHHGRPRRLALRLLDRLDPTFGQELLPRLLDDPEFRRDAVQKALDTGDATQTAGDLEGAIQFFQKAFEHARESDQVTGAADRLRALGQPADVAEHLGLIIDWHVVGPFDAPLYSGFQQSFEPEQGVDLAATYKGKNGATISWKPYHTADPLGQVNLLEAIAPAAEAVGYAYCEVRSPTTQEAQLRCGADDNLAVWLNGEQVFAREQWLNGIRLDRFAVPVTLREGVNQVLVKICQGPQHKDPQVGNNWTLQLRFCDEKGAGLGLKTER